MTWRRLAGARRSPRQDLIDDRIVGQRHVHAIGAGDRLGRRRRDLRAERFERARLGFGPVPHRHRVAAAQHPLDHRAAQQSRSRETPRSPSQASRYNLSQCVAFRHSQCSSASARSAGRRCGLPARAAALRARRSRACCAGRAILKAARRLSRPIRPIPTSSSASTSRSPTCSPPGLGRTPRVRQRPLRVDRPVHRPRRRRHRPERHRRHAGAARDDGGDDAVLRVPRGAERPRRRRGALPLAGRPARQDGRRRSAARSPTRSCCAPSASTACTRCRTKTTCIRTAIW